MPSSTHPKRKILGKLDTALLTKVTRSPNTKGITPFAEIPINQLFPNPNQPRKEFNQESLQELAQSIKAQGLIQPIAVSKRDLQYMIVSGERRYQAISKYTDFKTIRCHVLQATDKEIMEIALVENIQRDNLTAMEEALYILELQKTGNYTGGELAHIIGKSPSYISKALRATKLPEHLINAIRGSDRTYGMEIIQELARVKDPDKQQLLFDIDATREEIREQCRKEKEPKIEEDSPQDIFTKAQKLKYCFTGECDLEDYSVIKRVSDASFSLYENTADILLEKGKTYKITIEEI